MRLPDSLRDNRNSIFWFRRDLRLHDNRGFFEALSKEQNVIPLFIFDENILDDLAPTDKRVKIIYQLLEAMNDNLRQMESGIIILFGKPLEIFREVNVKSVYLNTDYEPYATERDRIISEDLSQRGIKVNSFKDHVIFEKDELLTGAGGHYTVYTPYSKNWLRTLSNDDLLEYSADYNNLFRGQLNEFPSLKSIGFDIEENIEFPVQIDPGIISEYHNTRDTPSKGTSRLGIALRFGAISLRYLVREIRNSSSTFLGELIWRDFFQSIIFHFPDSAYHNFRRKYDNVEWRFDEEQFEKWKTGQTGYPMVDAGMRELNTTGFMHNRVRMVTASFLVKHLLHHWSYGEAYFAEKLLDFDLASNVGNWQWAAGTGCDAAPYFRVFNPESQMKRFDPDLTYVKQWVPEYGSAEYIQPVIDHKEARERAIATYKMGLAN